MKCLECVNSEVLCAVSSLKECILLLKSKEFTLII